MQSSVLFYNVPNRYVQKCRNWEISLEPRLSDLVTDCDFGLRHDLPELAAALHSCTEQIRDVKDELGDAEAWEGIVRVADTFTSEPASVCVEIYDLTPFGVAYLDAPDSGRKMVISVPYHRLKAATPQAVRSQIGFLGEAVAGNICRELSRHRLAESTRTLVFGVEVDVRGHARELYILQRIVIAAMIPWLTVRDAVAHFASDRGKRAA